MKKMTDAEKATLKKLMAGKGALANGKLSMDQKLELQALKKKAKASTSYSPKPMGLYEQGQTSRAAAKKQAEKVTAKRLKATKYAPAPMTAKQKETTRRAAEKKQALRNLKKDPIVKGAKAVLKTAGNPVGAGLKAAGAAVKRAKTVAREVRDVPTAVGTSLMGHFNPSGIVKQGPSTKNLTKQVKEAGRAILTGKKGTASDRNTRSVRGATVGTVTGKYGYEKGKKRK
jgi:hypothetical protein